MNTNRYRLPDATGSILVVLPVVGLAVAAALWQIHAVGEPLRELPWTVARAAGLVAFSLCWLLTLLGLVLAHPAAVRLVARVAPWHQWLGLFTIAFVAVHVAAVLADPYAHVGPLGVLLPGGSGYRPVPVALGVMALWSLLLVGLTARFAQRLPPGTWRQIHAGALIVFLLAFFHGILTGSDTHWLRGYYAFTGMTVWAAAVARYWTPRPTTRRGLQR